MRLFGTQPAFETADLKDVSLVVGQAVGGWVGQGAGVLARGRPLEGVADRASRYIRSNQAIQELNMRVGMWRTRASIVFNDPINRYLSVAALSVGLAVGGGAGVAAAYGTAVGLWLLAVPEVKKGLIGLFNKVGKGLGIPGGLEARGPEGWSDLPKFIATTATVAGVATMGTTSLLVGGLAVLVAARSYIRTCQELDRVAERVPDDPPMARHYAAGVWQGRGLLPRPLVSGLSLVGIDVGPGESFGEQADVTTLSATHPKRRRLAPFAPYLHFFHDVRLVNEFARRVRRLYPSADKAPLANIILGWASSLLDIFGSRVRCHWRASFIEAVVQWTLVVPPVRRDLRDLYPKDLVRAVDQSYRRRLEAALKAPARLQMVMTHGTLFEAEEFNAIRARLRTASPSRLTDEVLEAIGAHLRALSSDPARAGGIRLGDETPVFVAPKHASAGEFSLLHALLMGLLGGKAVPKEGFFAFPAGTIVGDAMRDFDFPRIDRGDRGRALDEMEVFARDMALKKRDGILYYPEGHRTSSKGGKEGPILRARIGGITAFARQLAEMAARREGRPEDVVIVEVGTNGIGAMMPALTEIGFPPVNLVMAALGKMGMTGQDIDVVVGRPLRFLDRIKEVEAEVGKALGMAIEPAHWTDRRTKIEIGGEKTSIGKALGRALGRRFDEGKRGLIPGSTLADYEGGGGRRFFGGG